MLIVNKLNFKLNEIDITLICILYIFQHLHSFSQEQKNKHKMCRTCIHRKKIDSYMLYTGKKEKILFNSQITF